MYVIHCYVNYINVLIHIMSHNITVASEGVFIRDVCRIRNDYTIFNNCAITKELVFLINYLCTSSQNHIYVFI